MDHYVDIVVKQGLDFKHTVIMNHLYASLHKALYDCGNKEVGCSFPKVSKKSLGECLRLHGSKEALERLMAMPWSKNFEDYVVVNTIAKIPQHVQYRVVKRVQAKSSPERMLRRSIKRGTTSLEEAEKKLLVMEAKTTTLPYLRIKSISTNQHFRLFVKHDEILQRPVEGSFNHYGFSQVATIPWF